MAIYIYVKCIIQRSTQTPICSATLLLSRLHLFSAVILKAEKNIMGVFGCQTKPSLASIVSLDRPSLG